MSDQEKPYSHITKGELAARQNAMEIIEEEIFRLKSKSHHGGLDDSEIKRLDILYKLLYLAKPPLGYTIVPETLETEEKQSKTKVLSILKQPPKEKTKRKKK